MRIGYKKLDKLGYDSIKVKINPTENKIIDDYADEEEDDDENIFARYFCWDCLITLDTINFNTGKEEKIGYLKGFYFPPKMELERLGVEQKFVDITDENDDNLSGWADFLCNKDQENSKPQVGTLLDNIFYISELQIYPKFQNLGIASFLIKNLYKILIYKCFTFSNPVFMVYPFPFLLKGKASKEEIEREKEKLVDFYKKIGFIKYKNTSLYFFYNVSNKKNT